jgi:radical SAM protein with 4Fe4S-binding SPASM domain
MVIGVVTRQNWERAFEVAEHLTDLGVESARLNPVYGAGRGRDVAIQAEEYFHFLSGVLAFLGEKRAFREENLAAMARNLVARTRDYRCMRSPCAAGYDHLAIDPAGDVYPCGAFRLAVPESRMGRLVDLTSLDGAYLNNELLEKMASRIVANIPACADCPWRHLCEGGCSLDAYANQGGLMKPCSLCGFYRQMYPQLLSALAHRPALLNLLVPEALWCHV